MLEAVGAVSLHLVLLGQLRLVGEMAPARAVVILGDEHAVGFRAFT